MRHRFFASLLPLYALFAEFFLALECDLLEVNVPLVNLHLHEVNCRRCFRIMIIASHVVVVVPTGLECTCVGVSLRCSLSGAFLTPIEAYCDLGGGLLLLVASEEFFRDVEDTRRYEDVRLDVDSVIDADDACSLGLLLLRLPGRSLASQNAISLR